MTALLYYSISSTFKENKIIEIDRRVTKDRKEVYIFVRNLGANKRHRNKKIILIIALVSGVWFNNLKSAQAIGLSLPPSQIGRVHEASYDYRPEIKIAKTISPKLYKITFLKSRELSFLVCMTDQRFIRTSEINKLIKKLRGGSLTTVLIGNAIFLTILYSIWVLGEGFVVPPPNPGWGMPRGLYDPPGLVRPRDCGTQLYAGSPTQSLKTWEDRNKPSPKDRWFLVGSRPESIMRRGQSRFKTKDHGALAGLPYSVKNNGSTSTLKTEENVDIFMNVVEEIVYDPNTLWFEEATYQGGTDRELESINLYSEEHNRVVVFLRSTGEFISFCEPSLNEVEDLSRTENFGGQDNWFSSTPKNMPPQKDFISDFTPVNSFESDVMGITPISSMDENSSSNRGFTPLNSFENDVLGITPFNPD
jgi:hypothetical protein